MKKDVNAFLKDILASIKAIEKYTKDLSEEKFIASQEKQDAVMRRVEIIGEAVRNIPTDFKQAHRDIPWQKISGMRDKLIHGYSGIDLSLVWNVVKKDIPPLKAQIKEILKSTT